MFLKKCQSCNLVDTCTEVNIAQNDNTVNVIKVKTYHKLRQSQQMLTFTDCCSLAEEIHTYYGGNLKLIHMMN